MAEAVEAVQGVEAVAIDEAEVAGVAAAAAVAPEAARRATTTDGDTGAAERGFRRSTPFLEGRRLHLPGPPPSSPSLSTCARP